MKTTGLRKLILLAVIGLFFQFVAAQNEDNAAALKMIADIVVGLNHFPSDDDLATLDQIIANSELIQAVREMANAVAGIEHVCNEESRAAMEAIQKNAQVPARTRALAGIIESFSHNAGDDDKKQLAGMFP